MDKLTSSQDTVYSPSKTKSNYSPSGASQTLQYRATSQV